MDEESRKEVEEYVDQHLATTDLGEEDAELFRELVERHVLIGSMPEEPPEIIGIKDKVLREFLDFTYFVYKTSMSQLVEAGIVTDDQPPHVAFQTGYTMGMAMGAVMERMKHGQVDPS